MAIAPLTNGVVVSLGGSTHSGTLVVDGSVLGALNTGTLRIGSYNDATNGGAATLTAAGISVDGPVNLIGHATTLLLNTSGRHCRDRIWHDPGRHADRHLRRQRAAEQPQRGRQPGRLCRE